MFARYPINSIDLDFRSSYHIQSRHIVHCSFLIEVTPIYSPKGLPALPFLTVVPVTPGLEAMLAAPPAAPVDKPSGFPFVVARLPAAPVTSLIELPYSRTMSPQPREVFAMLCIVSIMSS
jgi:hypothetical protein